MVLHGDKLTMRAWLLMLCINREYTGPAGGGHADHAATEPATACSSTCSMASGPETESGRNVTVGLRTRRNTKRPSVNKTMYGDAYGEHVDRALPAGHR